MKKYISINILVLSSQLFSLGAFAGEGWIIWHHANNQMDLLRQAARVELHEEEEEDPAQLEALRVLAEDVALRALNDQDEQAVDHLQQVAEGAALNVLDESDEDAANPPVENTWDSLEASSENCAEESGELCEELCSDEPEASSSDLTPNSPTSISSNAENSNPLYKSKLCRYYMQYGACKHGTNCQYAHGTKQLRNNNPNLKTKLCRNWKLFGRCSYGSSCHFAHGDGDIRK